ncbi:D-alanyl-D-alanine carboxypeptidase/D-alanyl-D-alanine-endopeptidase [Kibdelosporangium phytohabitans]|uniref:D-alanyl-D-alanine carboxypeptidase/D-alanyl-D-alanine endopeptidase n=1 Tax=Kibdelosporangium phytohabitans TaxID=860235 RepID=UPI00147073C5|nr:D-alanyl-D-alanine carboxypeptidase/D-alanyl-D-alanine-endopeptidase [Kibdelosporangium phytohabitans]MBE1466078.1 D-alanyl-D-alanine carboxypeptidase/D-alanyl-D-alanine-endopeptidase (penicillin-binding protein 4) [Kibdelosporangium phytohabitans]
MSAPSLFTPRPPDGDRAESPEAAKPPRSESAEATARTEPVQPPADEAQSADYGPQPVEAEPSSPEPARDAAPQEQPGDGAAESTARSEPVAQPGKGAQEPGPAEPQDKGGEFEPFSQPLFSPPPRPEDLTRGPQASDAQPESLFTPHSRSAPAESGESEATVRSEPGAEAFSQSLFAPTTRSASKNPPEADTTGDSAAESTARSEPVRPQDPDRSGEVSAEAWPSEAARPPRESRAGLESAGDGRFSTPARNEPVRHGADEPAAADDSSAEATMRSLPVQPPQPQRETGGSPKNATPESGEGSLFTPTREPMRPQDRRGARPGPQQPESGGPARNEPIRPPQLPRGAAAVGLESSGEGPIAGPVRNESQRQEPGPFDGPTRSEPMRPQDRRGARPGPQQPESGGPARNEPIRPPQLPRGAAAMGLESSGEGPFAAPTRSEPLRQPGGGQQRPPQGPRGLETAREGPFAAPTRSEPMRPPQRPMAGPPMGLETSGEGPFAVPTRSEPMRPPGARPDAPTRPGGEPVRPPAGLETSGKPVDHGQFAATIRTEPVRPPAEETEPPFPLGSDDDPPAPPSDGDTPKGKRPRKGLFVLAALVLVIALGAGVVFFVPGVRAKLGLGGSDADEAVAPPPSPVAFTPSIKGAGGGAPAPTQQGVQGVLAGPAGNAALGTLTGTVIDPASGNVLWNKASNTPLTPASTTKLLTAAAALLKLPHGQQFSTKVVAGPQPGSVIVVGGGDGTLNSLPAGKNSVFPGSPRLDDLVAQVKAKGPVSQVFLDRTRYTADNLAPGVLPGDVAEGYISPITPLMMDGARQDPTKDKSPRSANPPRTVAAEFAKRIGASVAASPEVTAPADAQVLGEVRSAPLTELVDQFLQASDNVLADVVAREVAIAAGEEPSFQGVHKATLKVLAENGFDVTGAELFDGSGMSTSNKTTSLLLAKVLAAAAGDGKDEKSAKLRPMLGGLPVAGGSGTLEGRFAAGQPAAGGRGWVRAKTGTLPLAGINSLAGVVLDTDGRLLVFALMTNGSDTIQARPALDAVAAALRTCGCK